MTDQTPPSHPLTAPAARPPAMPPSQAQPKADRTGLAIALMAATSLIFAIQDGLSRQLAGNYSPIFIVMLRFWFFAIFAVVLVSRQPGGLRRAMRSKRPLTQITRSILLVAEIVVIVEAFVQLGLVETHAIFASYPLIIAALSGPVLGEKVGWRRWIAIGIGFVGILIILQPGAGVFAPVAILPVISAVMFAVYGLLTRHVARDDPATVSFFWTGICGAIPITAIGIWHWEWLAPIDWLWMAALCVCAAISHYMLIRAYELAEASTLQPFAYTQLAWVSVIGVVFFHETLRPNVVIGATIVVAAGLFTLWRTRLRAQQRG